MIIDLTNTCLCCERITPEKRVKEGRMTRLWSVWDQYDVIYNIAKNYVESTENLDYYQQKFKLISDTINEFKKHKQLWQLFKDGKIEIVDSSQQ